MKFPKAKIYSLPELIELLYKHWCPRKQHRWIPHVEYARNLFSKDIHNGSQIDEASNLSSTVDEDPQANEHDDGPTYEDPKVLVEEAEK